MPSIKIREIDTTSGGTVLTAEDVVFVPGFVNADYIEQDACAAAYQPILCETVSEFEYFFGAEPPVFTAGEAYPTGFAADALPVDANLINAGDMDRAYVFAKELLNAGLPVYYVRINESATDITAAHMYEVLAGKSAAYDMWEDLEDVGEYNELKYITTGGYPNFEYYVMPNLVPEAENVTITSFNEATFKTQVGTDVDKKCVFTYAEDPTESSKKNDVTYSWYLTVNGGVASKVTLATYGLAVTGEQVGSKITISFTVAKYSVIASKMISCAATRGDCVALIDHTNNPDREVNPNSTHSVYYSISSDNSTYKISVNGEFATMFTPWCGCSFASTLIKGNVPAAMPASFMYLMAMAESVQTNVNWLAIAGASRGIVNITQPALNGNLRISNAIADNYQPRNGIAINPITNIKPYGYLIWGNRTLKNNAIEGNLTATSFLNTRNMVSDIKKIAYNAAKRCMFEQNSDILWVNYKARITPTLEQMVSGAGLSGYKIIKGTTTEKAKLVCTIRIYPLYAVESFDITVELADDEVTIS